MYNGRSKTWNFVAVFKMTPFISLVSIASCVSTLTWMFRNYSDAERYMSTVRVLYYEYLHVLKYPDSPIFSYFCTAYHILLQWFSKWLECFLLCLIYWTFVYFCFLVHELLMFQICPSARLFHQWMSLYRAIKESSTLRGHGICRWQCYQTLLGTG